MIETNMIETIQWTDAGVVMIDQTRLPREEVYVTCTDHLQVADAIRSMVIRGAPAIGVAAAMGIALGMQQARFRRSVRRNLRNPPADASHRGQSVLGHRTHAARLPSRPRPQPSGDPREAGRRSHPDSPGRHRHQRVHREERRAR